MAEELAKDRTRNLTEWTGFCESRTIVAAKSAVRLHVPRMRSSNMIVWRGRGVGVSGREGGREASGGGRSKEE